MPASKFPGFPGFNEPQFTLTPDILFDELAPALSECELRVLLYIIRRTFGFKKSADLISINQMAFGITTRTGKVLDRGTGMSRTSVIKGAKLLAAKGIIVSAPTRDEKGGFTATAYRLRFRNVDNYGKTSQDLVQQLHPPSAANGLGLVQQLNPQVETVLQDTVKQHNSDSSNEQTEFLDELIEDITHELNDPNHLKSNVTRARRLFMSSGLSAEDFQEEIYEARDRAKKRTGIRHNGEQPFTKNRMPYFFKVLESLTDPK